MEWNRIGKNNGRMDWTFAECRGTESKQRKRREEKRREAKKRTENRMESIGTYSKGDGMALNEVE